MLTIEGGQKGPTDWTTLKNVPTSWQLEQNIQMWSICVLSMERRRRINLYLVILILKKRESSPRVRFDTFFGHFHFFIFPIFLD